MNITVYPSLPHGIVTAPSSKSAVHRALICSAFSSENEETLVRCDEISEDISATAECLRAVGAELVYEKPFFRIKPAVISEIPQQMVLNCRESGSSLRFLLPIIAALGTEHTEFITEGSLARRTHEPLLGVLCENGVSVAVEDERIVLSGKLSGNEFSVDGGLSSQFVSGMLLALAIAGGEKRLTVVGEQVSQPYITLTENILSSFSAAPQKDGNTYIFTDEPLHSPKMVDTEGDWSNGAFWLCLGALVGEGVTLTGVSRSSAQGDRRIWDILKAFGAKTEQTDRGFTAYPSRLKSTEINAVSIPDLVPIIATVASVAEGETVIFGAKRLENKESNRLSTTASMLTSLGADIKKTDDGLIIRGKKILQGGIADRAGDHRIAMSAAVAASVCRYPVTIKGAEAVNKSYPAFFKELESLGVKCKLSE